jgi:hypothetical protein
MITNWHIISQKNRIISYAAEKNPKTLDSHLPYIASNSIYFITMKYFNTIIAC